MDIRDRDGSGLRDHVQFLRTGILVRLRASSNRRGLHGWDNVDGLFTHTLIFQSCRASLSAEDTRRAFPVAAAQAWNSLPSHVTSSSSLASFKRSLKTELFLKSYVQVWYRLMLHVTFLTLIRAFEVNFDLRHVNHIRYYYYYMLKDSKYPRFGNLKIQWF